MINQSTLKTTSYNNPSIGQSQLSFLINKKTVKHNEPQYITIEKESSHISSNLAHKVYQLDILSHHDKQLSSQFLFVYTTTFGIIIFRNRFLWSRSAFGNEDSYCVSSLVVVLGSIIVVNFVKTVNFFNFFYSNFKLNNLS
jgi:hypothetical protein